MFQADFLIEIWRQTVRQADALKGSLGNSRLKGPTRKIRMNQEYNNLVRQ